jgi:hypothetical protein
MKFRFSLLGAALLLSASFFAGQGFAQQGVLKGPVHPTQVDDTFLQQAGARAEFDHSDRTGPAAQDAKKLGRVLSVPTFTTSFNFQGQNFPVQMVGSAPHKGDTTEVPTQLIAISLFFDGYVDANGNNIVLDATPIVAPVLNSPNFRNASYRTGVTQFADAVQRAEFNGAMRDDWHTLLAKPELLKSVQIEVPPNTALGQVFQVRNSGKMYAIVDTSFFISQLNTIIQLQNLNIQGLPIALTNNVFLSPNAHVERCCVVGFHTAFDQGMRDGRQMLQTFVWASYVSTGIFGGTFEDVIALSHEISEWMNDPFITNAVPRWQYPNSTDCQSSMETGDPMETMPNAGFPVTIDTMTYHPQTQALMQWFARKPASDAINAAYSFPDESLLTAPAQACPAGR